MSYVIFFEEIQYYKGKLPIDINHIFGDTRKKIIPSYKKWGGIS